MKSLFPAQGTLVNVIAIILGGILGRLFGKKVKPSLQETLLKMNGIALIGSGIVSFSEHALRIQNKALVSHGTLLCIIALSLGSVIGETLDIEKGFLSWGNWLKKKTGNQGDSRFLQAFCDTTLTVCIGAMAIIGSLEDGIHQNPQILYSKAVIDFIIVMMLSASLGKGAIFSALPVGIWQGFITLFATLVAPYLSALALENISLVGNLLICCVGINLAFDKKIRVANVLPSLLIAYLFSFF